MRSADKRDLQKMCAGKYKVCKQNVNMNRIVQACIYEVCVNYRRCVQIIYGMFANHIRGVCDQKIIPTQERRHCLIASHSSQRLNILQCR